MTKKRKAFGGQKETHKGYFGYVGRMGGGLMMFTTLRALKMIKKIRYTTPTPKELNMNRKIKINIS
jgi:hypothetical protein